MVIDLVNLACIWGPHINVYSAVNVFCTKINWMDAKQMQIRTGSIGQGRTRGEGAGASGSTSTELSSHEIYHIWPITDCHSAIMHALSSLQHVIAYFFFYLLVDTKETDIWGKNFSLLMLLCVNFIMYP